MWLILLMVLGVAFVILELFVPSGGVLSFLAAISVVGAIFSGYYYFGSGPGTLVLLIEAILVPVTIVVAIRVWPYTAIGRRVLNILPGEQPEGMGEAESAHNLRDLVGKWGRAKSPLLPSGAVVIDGRMYDAISRGMPIDAGQAIEVVHAEGNHIVVKASHRDLPPEPQRDVNKDDILAQPAETLGIEPLDDPLG
jgi:membrane-bound serine protease (ClpP class)